MKNKTAKLDYVLHFNPDNAKEAFEIIDWVIDRYKYFSIEYRKKWGLPHDYPMVAPSYPKRAKEIKLEQKT